MAVATAERPSRTIPVAATSAELASLSAAGLKPATRIAMPATVLAARIVVSQLREGPEFMAGGGGGGLGRRGELCGSQRLWRMTVDCM